MHQLSNPSILYFGTPVVLISTLNEDESYNIAPISSVFWLGYRCVIGVGLLSKTAENILRRGECVINLPSEDMAPIVDRLALTTGRNPVPATKIDKGYRYVHDKFRHAGVTAVRADLISTPLIGECPVRLETTLVTGHPLGAEKGPGSVRTAVMELKVVRVHVDKKILVNGSSDHIDPDKWRPLMMSFQKFYGLGEQLYPSRLATIREELYRNADTEEAAR